jgi:hypothetical protein
MEVVVKRSCPHTLAGLCAGLLLGLLFGPGALGVPRPAASTAPAARPGRGAEGDGGGFERDAPPPPRARKIERLTDDPGRGEVVPRGRIEATFGLAGAESLPTHPGAVVGLAALARPVADLWLGGGLEYRVLTGADRYASLSDWSVFAQARYYFMPHREANRFIMGYALLQLGYARLAASGVDTATRSQGVDLGLGVGVGVALSTRVYLGLQFKFRFPVWVRSCLEIANSRACTSDPADFPVTTWQFTLAVSRAF